MDRLLSVHRNKIRYTRNTNNITLSLEYYNLLQYTVVPKFVPVCVCIVLEMAIEHTVSRTREYQKSLRYDTESSHANL